MAEVNQIAGNIIGVQINDEWLQCQAEATLNLVLNTSESPICKVLDGTASAGAPYKRYTDDSREWNITTNNALLKDSFATLNNGVNLAKLFVDGDYYIQSVLFRTAEGQQFADNDMIYEGSAFLTNFSITAPATGANTTSATFQGDGELTYSYPPKTT